MKKTSLAIAGTTLAALLVSFAVWSQVPDPMPIHWDETGTADGWWPRWLGLTFTPLMNLALGGLIGFLTLRHAEAKKVAALVAIILGAFWLGMHLLIVRAALDPSASLSIAGVIMLVGVLSIGLGFVMAKVGPNPYVGIRVPWTMNDETNWKLTHRFARATFVAAGVSMIALGAILPPPFAFWVPIAVFLVASLAPIVFSYAIYKSRPKR